MKGNQKIFYLLLLAFLLATGYTEIARAQVVYSDSVKILYPKEVTLDTLSGSVGISFRCQTIRSHSSIRAQRKLVNI